MELTTALVMSALHCTTPANVAMPEFTLSTPASSVTVAALNVAAVQLIERVPGALIVTLAGASIVTPDVSSFNLPMPLAIHRKRSGLPPRRFR